jgi:hypothetical protein
MSRIDILADRMLGGRTDDEARMLLTPTKDQWPSVMDPCVYMNVYI